MRRRMLLVPALALLAGLLVAPPAHAATTYYFSTSGSDANNGLSEAAPKKTASAFNSLVLTAGDTVKFKGGDAFSGTTRWLVSASEDGTSSTPINITRYGPEGDGRPVFSGGGSNECWRSEGAWVNFDNVKIANCTGNYGLNVFGANTLVQNSNVSLNKTGIKLSDSGSGHAQYSRVTQTTVENNDQGGASGIEGYGILVNADDVTVDRNTFKSQSTPVGSEWKGADIEVYGGDRGTYSYNWSDDSNGFTEMGHDEGATASGNVFRYNRVLVDCTDGSCAEGGGFNLRGASSEYGPIENTTIEHNTVKVTVGNGEALVCSSGCPDSTIMRDNVWVHTGSGLASYIDNDGSAAWTEGGNVYDGTTNPSSFTPAASSVEGSMSFVSATDLRPAAGSLAIDRGLTAPFATDYYGSVVPQDGDCSGTAAPDSGYAEYDNPGC